MDYSPLALLCTRAGICATPLWLDTWFRGCTLTRNQLLCPDQETADGIARMFLPDLRAVLADLEVRVIGTKVAVTGGWKAKPKGLYKPGHEPSDYRQPDKDLLK